jgi:hypothetical protein
MPHLSSALIPCCLIARGLLKRLPAKKLAEVETVEVDEFVRTTILVED